MRVPGQARRWLGLVPFILSALLFVSAVLTVIAPLPLLLLGFRKGRKWCWLAAVTNAAAVLALAGGISSLSFGVLAAVPALMSLELLRRKVSVERTAIACLAVMTLAGAIAVNAYSRLEHAHPIAEIHNRISDFVDYLGKSESQENGEGSSGTTTRPSDVLGAGQHMDPAELEEWKQNLIVELPGKVAIMGLVIVWLNLSLLIHLNPARLRERLGLPADYLQTWKSPEFLVWPTIAAGATLLVDFHKFSEVGRNIFNFLMAIYAIQGLSVLAYFFSLWRVRRVFRVLGYLVGVLMMTPLVLSLGFFDLWFDFRSKFRQS